MSERCTYGDCRNAIRSSLSSVPQESDPSSRFSPEDFRQAEADIEDLRVRVGWWAEVGDSDHALADITDRYARALEALKELQEGPKLRCGCGGNIVWSDHAIRCDRCQSTAVGRQTAYMEESAVADPPGSPVPEPPDDSSDEAYLRSLAAAGAVPSGRLIARRLEELEAQLTTRTQERDTLQATLDVECQVSAERFAQVTSALAERDEFQQVIDANQIAWEANQGAWEARVKQAEGERDTALHALQKLRGEARPQEPTP